MIDDLMRVAASRGPVDDPRNDDQRHPLLQGVGDAVHRVCKSGSDGRQQDLGTAGHGARACGHDGGCGLVAGEVELHSGRLKRIEHCDDFAAGHPEGVRHAVAAKRSGHHVGYAHRHLVCRCRVHA